MSGSTSSSPSLLTVSPHPPITIGVLALQGAFLEHLHCLRQLSIPCIEVRTVEQLRACDGLIIPGGESTAIALLAQREKLLDSLRVWSSQRRPVFGTCAGLILIADSVTGQKRGGQELIGGMHITVQRNHYGTQLGSFRTALHVPALATVSGYEGSTGDSDAVFIRAPGIVSVAEAVEVLATIPKEDDVRPLQQGKRRAIAGVGEEDSSALSAAGGVDYRGVDVRVVPVAVREGNFLATTFHPELTKELRWHAMFAEMVRKDKTERMHRGDNTQQVTLVAVSDQTSGSH